MNKKRVILLVDLFFFLSILSYVVTDLVVDFSGVYIFENTYIKFWEVLILTLIMIMSIFLGTEISKYFDFRNSKKVSLIAILNIFLFNVKTKNKSPMFYSILFFLIPLITYFAFNQIETNKIKFNTIINTELFVESFKRNSTSASQIITNSLLLCLGIIMTTIFAQVTIFVLIWQLTLLVEKKFLMFCKILRNCDIDVEQNRNDEINNQKIILKLNLMQLLFLNFYFFNSEQKIKYKKLKVLKITKLKVVLF
ncbi:hypothetical protein SCHIN_v1c05820 [Spiroplasma chinense]|uniref:Uncharacterized protein n=1 Tax=Spiroplasma chinense TaxID=216932 RepID=A0A5B9Y517_9MOLU|nr:hypothetical protein [Spiroplasma chinense]QEH61779.1 hypothetical protein SCHIN_v1c05820 [Spiroplasma chinense]